MHRSLAILLLFQLASSVVAFQTLGSKQAATGGRRPVPKIHRRLPNEVDCTTSSEDEWDESCNQFADEDDENAFNGETYIFSNSNVEHANRSNSGAGAIVFAALALIAGAALIATRLRRDRQEEDTTTDFIEIRCIPHHPCGSALA